MGGTEREAIEAHVRTCPECAELLRTLARTWELAGLIETIEPSDSFDDSLWNSIRRRERMVSRCRFWPAMARPVAYISALLAPVEGRGPTVADAGDGDQSTGRPVAAPGGG